MADTIVVINRDEIPPTLPVNTSTLKPNPDDVPLNLIEVRPEVDITLPTFYDPLGRPITYTLNEGVEDLLRTYTYALSRASSPERIEEIQKKIDEIQAGIASADPTYVTADLDNTDAAYEMGLLAWDPRLQRLDTFFRSPKNETGNTPTLVPFASATGASAFSDLVYVQRKAVADMIKPYVKSEVEKTSSENAGQTQDTKDQSKDEQSGNQGSTQNIGFPIQKEINNNAYNVPMSHESYEDDANYYGVASLMNPYSITKLMGGIGEIEKHDTGYVLVKKNYMYDVRDQRRFYGLSISDAQDVLSVSIPSIRNIIAFSNNDKWGRTPYTYQDFVYSKWFGLIPNNRLITLRRYHAPTYDNLLFEGMSFSDDTEEGNSGLTNINSKSEEKRTETKAFSPRCTLVTYFGDETGNTLSSILKFSSGIEWADAEAKIWDVQGDLGEDAQSTIDRMFDGGNGYTGSGHTGLNNFINKGNMITGKILSFGKFAASLKQNFGMDQDAFDNMTKIMQDPYADSTYENRIRGPINRIDKVKKRKEGITFDLSFLIKFSYTARSIGGINPKAALLDILGNCLEMVSADALFWGGGHKFMINPKLYPYHDGGWRDSFMKKLYDGKIFGKDGAMDYVLRGVKNFASTDANGKQSEEGIWGNLTSHLGDFLGQGLGAIGSLISSAGSALFGEGSDNFLTAFGNKVSDMTDDEKKLAGVSKMNKLFGNLNNMWHNKVMAKTMVPLIKGMNSLLIGEPVGEWHLTIGNPLNPIMVVGNLICEKMDVEFSDVLGPDDFPEELSVTYSLQHGMARDKSAIQSMFNRGMGKYYVLPDYIRSTSDYETEVDYYTGGTGFREPAYEAGPSMLSKQMALNGYKGVSTYQNYKVDPGSEPKNQGHANLALVTKFTAPDIGQAADFVGSGSWSTAATAGSTIPVIRSLAITRKYTT